jgi:hypothetical protein
MPQLARCLSFAALVLVVTCASAWAQATASISGTVRDESGAVLPGVTITATQSDTGLMRTAVTNETGSFALLNLPLGPYRVEATLQGFHTYAQTGIVLQVGSNPVVNPTLSIGALAETIQVTATATLVETRSASVGTIVESQRIVELPLNARQVTQLITLSGLAVQTTASPGFSMNTGVRIAVAGGNDFGVSYSLDGAPHLNNFDGTGMHLPFPDALQEFRFVTGAQEPSGGIRAGAAVNAVTKAGTNVVHGDLFEFIRDSRFNAEDPFSHRKDGLKRNQFGGTLGGPIQRDKLFFFVGLQATTTRQNPLDQTAFVPTAAMRAGDFTAFASPACNNGRQLNLGAPFAGNRIDPALMSRAALNIAAKLPQPIDECGKVFWGSPVHRNETQLPVRIDYHVNQKHTLLARYMLTTDNKALPFDEAGGNILVTSEPASDDRAHNITFGDTWVVGPTMVNSFRVFGNDVLARKPGPKFFSPQDVGINAFTYVPGYIRLIVNPNFNVGSGSFSSNTYTKVQNVGLSNDLTLVKGSHQYGFGGHYLWTKSDSVANAFSVGAYTFTGARTGNSVADFMIGNLGLFRQASENPVQVTQPVMAGYAQDTWNINRVTLNYGVVWNPFLSMNFYNGDIYTFDRDRFLAGETSTAMKNAPPGFFYPGDPGFNGKSGVNAHLNSWDPRVGFAWDIGGDGRSSVRGGASLGHDYVHHQLHLNTSSSAPFRLNVLKGAGTSFDNPWAGDPRGNPFPFTFNAVNPQFPIYSSFLPIPADLKPMTQYSWNFGYQRQLSRRLFASATYIGSKVNHLFTAEEQNPALNLGFGPCTLYDAAIGAERSYPVCTTSANIDQRRALNLARPGTALGYVTAYSDEAYQNYNGMLLTSRLDLGQYLNFNANYTLSKCVGVNTNMAVVNPGANYLHQPFQNNGPQNIKLDEGPCTSDRRHLFNLTSVFRSGSYGGVLGAIASDWTASSVIQMRSGAPLDIRTGADIALNGFTDNTATQRPNLVPGVNPYGDRDALVGYLNLAAFTQPAAGTLGDTPFNYVRGPGFWQWDQSFVRAFNVGNGPRIELRAEGINLTNHLNRGNPGITINNPATFGRITSLAANATPRIWQFAVKYSF